MPRRPMPRFIAYFRVSTRRQEVSGLGLEAQREAVPPCRRLRRPRDPDVSGDRKRQAKRPAADRGRLGGLPWLARRS